MKKQLHGQDILIFHNPAAIANKTKVEWAEIEAALMSNCSYSGPVLNSLQRWVSLLTKQQQLLGEAARGASHPQVKCHQAWLSTADSPSVMCASLTRNGCAVERRPTNRWWAAGTSNL